MPRKQRVTATAPAPGIFMMTGGGTIWRCPVCNKSERWAFVGRFPPIHLHEERYVELREMSEVELEELWGAEWGLLASRMEFHYRDAAQEATLEKAFRPLDNPARVEAALEAFAAW